MSLRALGVVRMTVCRSAWTGVRLKRYDRAFDAAGRDHAISKSPGFTVLELLIVLGIVGVVSALILPAIQQSREAARQVRCKNQLHQIGVALHAYHTKLNCFPSGWIIEVPIGQDSQNGWGWLSMLLPNLGQSQVFNSI